MTSSSATASLVATDPATNDPAALDTFIARWQRAGGSERANYQLLLYVMCVVLVIVLD